MTKPLPQNAELLAIAQHVIWFEKPEKALADPMRFLTYLMTFGTAEQIAVVEKHVGRQAFAEALNKAPPGVMDKRSWWYWHAMFGSYPPPPMPVRAFAA